MKAAVLATLGAPLAVRRVPDPVLRPGEVIVDIAAAPVLSYASEVFGGARTYGLTLPAIPGCGAIGRVREVGADATRLKPGDWVFCDPTVRSRDDAAMPDIALQGWDSRGAGGKRLQEYYRDGPFAERMAVPTENAVSIGEIDARDAAAWCALLTLVIPFGGLLSAPFQQGETLLVSGATGYFGSATVAVALAMGAGRVVAPGRNAAVLEDLARRFGPRLCPVRLTGDAAQDAALMQAAAAGPIDCVLDFLPPSAPAAVARTAIMTVRQDGRVVLMGGIGLEGGEDLALPYPWLMLNNISLRGQWMYPPRAAAQLARMVQSGLLDLGQFTVKNFSLDQANEAIAHAAADAGPFRMTVITP